jgi:hypothetical protein
MMNNLVTSLRNEQESVVNAIIESRGGQLPATIEELTPILAFSKAKMEAYKALSDAAKKVSQQEELNRHALESGQRWGIVHLYGQKRLGEITREMPKAKPYPGSAGTVPGKRERLNDAGIDDRRASEAERIASHPEILDRVIERSERDGDIPTKTAVLNEIKKEHRKEVSQEIDRRKTTTADQARAIAPVEVRIYLTKLMQAMIALPAEPPADGWCPALLEEARGYAQIIINRLRRFTDE